MEKEWGLHVWSRRNLLEIMFLPIGVRLKDGMEWSIKDVRAERKEVWSGLLFLKYAFSADA